MPSDRSAAAVGQILDNITLAHELVADGDRDAFSGDWRNLYAATRCLEIISEASRRLDTALRARHLDIPWREIADAGNVYRHGYETVDARRIWDTIVIALPPLEAALRQEITPPAS